MVQASKRESKGNSFCVARGKARGPPSALPLLFLLSRVFPASCLLVPGLVYDLDWANRTASARLVLVLLCEGRLFFQKSKFPFGNLAKSKSIVLRPSLSVTLLQTSNSEEDIRVLLNLFLNHFVSQSFC